MSAQPGRDGMPFVSSLKGEVVLEPAYTGQP
jgi:hypothetical protein